MAPPFPESKITLDYPLYGCDFDPQDPNRLFVGGGGGASRTGVGNKITFLDVSSRDTFDVAGEISLSKNEDNVINLAVGQRKGKATLLYAGINSSIEDQQKGKNEHLRMFSAEPASKARSVMGARISEVARTSLFTTKSQDTYQRLLRLTQPFPDTPQFGAVATGLAKEAQIALFDVASGNNAIPRSRGVLDLKKEAVDLDVLQTGEDTYQLMYCDDYNIYTLDVTKNSVATADTTPTHIYTMPSNDIRPSIRCIRYLAPHFAIAVANLPRPGGVVLYGFRLPKAGKPETQAKIAINASLPKGMGAKATGLAVANLSPVSTPGGTQGDAQFVIAVASNDFSIHLYTLDHRVSGDIDLLANLLPLRTLKNVQPAMITNLCFSYFTPPKSGTARVQYLKLASTSVSNCVVVHSIALKKVFDRPNPAKIKRGGPPRYPRYVVEAKNEGPSFTNLMLFIATVVLLLGVLLQGALEIKGLSKPVVGGHHWLPSSWHAVPASPLVPHAGFLSRLLEEKRLDGKDKVILLDSGLPGEIKLATDHDGPAREWHELEPEQKELWKDTLKKGGHWTEDMGETIFKSILFGEMAGVVAGIIGG